MVGNPPPPEQARKAKPTAATTVWRAGQGQRRCHARGTWWQTTTVRSPCRGNRTARVHAVLGLALLAPSDFRGRGTALLLSATMSLGRGNGAVLGPHAIPSLPPLASLSLLAQVVDNNSAVPLPRKSDGANSARPKTACTRAVSTAYWRWRSQRGVEPTRGPGQGDTATGPLEVRKKRGGRRHQRRTRPGSACS